MLLLLHVKILPQVKVKRLQWGPSHHSRVCHLLKTGFHALLMMLLLKEHTCSTFCAVPCLLLHRCAYHTSFGTHDRGFSYSFQDNNSDLLFLFPVCCALHSLPSYLVDFCQIGALLLTRDKWASEWIYELARAIIHVTSQLEIIFQGERKEEWNVSSRKNEYAMFSVTLNSLSCLLGSMLRKMTDRILFGHKCMPAYLHFNYF